MKLVIECEAVDFQEMMLNGLDCKKRMLFQITLKNVMGLKSIDWLLNEDDLLLVSKQKEVL